MGSPYLIGVDIGTTSTKAVLVDESGAVTGFSQRTYDFASPTRGLAEQDPQVWVNATFDAISEVIVTSGITPSGVVGIGFSGQMHGTVCVDDSGEPLIHAILWADQRSYAEVAEINEIVGRGNLAKWTGNPIATGFQASTLRWLHNNRRDIFAKIDKVLLPKDYVRFRLTGEIGTDASDASSTLLFDVRYRTWSHEMLDALGFPDSWFPKVAESADCAGFLSKSAAKATGLTPGIPIAFGGGDQSIAAVGNGIINPGVVQSTIGTGGQIFSALDAPLIDSQLRTHTFCHSVPNRWYIMGAILSAGLSLKWFRDSVLRSKSEISYAELSQEAESVSAGSDGLIFLPYLLGERTPHMDPNAKAIFDGVSFSHSRGHFVRSIMEGVVFALRDSLEIVRELGVEVQTVVASGGGARSKLWRQIQADVFACPVVTSGVTEQAGLGAAMVGGVAAGVWKSVSDVCNLAVQYGDQVEPDRGRVELYEEMYQRYGELYTPSS